MLLSAVAAMVALLVTAPAAFGARDPIGSGNTDFHLKKGFLHKLNNNEIAVRPLGAGEVDGNKIGLKIYKGMFDPTTAQGYLENRGGFKFEAGRRGVPVTEITVNTVKGAVYAKIAKAHMQLAYFAPPVSDREGFGANLKAVKLSLTAKAARRISNRLGLKNGRRIAGGRVMSNLYSAVQPSTVTIAREGTVNLNANLGTLAKFAQKGVKVPDGFTALGPGKKTGNTSFSFPITGGTLSPDADAGTVETAGGVQIVKEAKGISPTLRLINIQLDFAANAATVEMEILPTPPFPGAVKRSSIVNITLNGGFVYANPNTREIAISKATASLQAVSAQTLNSVFNQPAPEPPPSSNFVVGDPLGLFSMVVHAQ